MSKIAGLLHNNVDVACRHNMNEEYLAMSNNPGLCLYFYWYLSASTRSVDVDHDVEVEVQQRVEGDELRGGVVGGVQPRHEVVLQHPGPELGVHDAHAEHDDHQHEASDELEAGLDELHRAEFYKRLNNEIHDVLGVHEEEEEKEESEAGVVRGVDLIAVGGVPHLVELLRDLHGERGQPHREHEAELGRVEAEERALGLAQAVQRAQPEQQQREEE